LTGRGPRLGDRNYLDLIPAQAVASETQAPDGKIVLLVPRYRDPVFGRLLQPRLRGEKRYIRVPLDARGSWLWPRIDGERTVGTLAREFRGAFPDDGEAVEERISRYVAALVGNGFVRLVNL
jgi:hypothetical protein